MNERKSTLRVHSLQHVAFEGLGSIEAYLISRGHILTSTLLFRENKFPAIEEIDWLIVMGGPMGVYDESEYSWLKREKAYIRESIEAGKTVLGICLGAQLIATVMGAKVEKNRYREIGWFPVTCSKEISDTLVGSILPTSFEAFHWHGDIFEIPEGATPLGSSMACDNQGFIYDNRILGFQFHLETTMESARSLIDNCRDELDYSRYVQKEAEMLADENRFARINGIMRDLLLSLEKMQSAAM